MFKLSPVHARTRWLMSLICSLLLFSCATPLLASEAELAIPDLNKYGSFTILDHTISAGNLLFYGSFVIAGTLGILSLIHISEPTRPY